MQLKERIFQFSFLVATMKAQSLHPANSYKIRARPKWLINIPANETPYPVLSDVGSVTANGFGIAFGLDVELHHGYVQFGNAFPAKDTCRLGQDIVTSR